MKRFNHFLPALLLLSITFVACDQRVFEMPPLDKPVYPDTATMTIADFKTQFAAATAVEITDSITISGIVVANDISGNMYKEMTIMDSTGGLKIAINQGDLYTEFRLGQRVFIECKGLWVGKYGDYMQLGSAFESSIGQMTWETAKAHIFLNGWPNPDDKLLTPEVIDISIVGAEANLGKLITLEDVIFLNGGKEVCASQTIYGSVQTENKILKSSKGSGSITVRLSSASDFANKILPANNGNLTGILTIYKTSASSVTYQFTPRDSMDFAFENFGSGYIQHGLGIDRDPYTVEYALTQQNKERTAWVYGYIVGVVNGSINSTNPIDGNDDISWTTPVSLDNTVVIASDSLEDDWKKCLVVNLPGGSSLRDLVNLRDNPLNIRKKLAVFGMMESYLGAGGVSVPNGTTAEYWLNIKPIIFSEPFSGSLGNFSTRNVLGTQVWVSSSYYGTYFAKMSGYSSGSFANEDWLISPAIDLTNYGTAAMSFMQANYYKSTSTISDENSLWISSDYLDGTAPSTATWTKLTIPNMQTAFSKYDFLSSGSINIPSEYLGKSVKIAFKYTSTNSTSSTWEVYNVLMTGTK